ncbi:MAG: PAS domain S-box protein [Agitococcus sp.]|nr:PAS domain S-box protein [Agitococcus sp.]
MPLAGYYRNELERVDKNSKRLREVMDVLSPAFFVGMLTIEGVMTYTNRTSLEAIGLELKDVIGRRFEDTPWWSYSELYRQQLREAIARAAKGEASRFDLISYGLDGRLLTLDFSLNPIFDVKKKVSYLVPSAHDVTKRRAAERALKMLSMCNKLLLHAQDEIILLHDVCQLMVNIGHYQLAWIGYALQDDAKTIKPMAKAGNDNRMLENLLLSWAEDDPRGQGASGRAIRTGKFVHCEDVQIETSSTYIQKVSQEKGFRGGIALPLREGNQTFGSLTIASSAVFKIENDEILLLQELADNLAYGIVTIRARHESQRILTVVDQIANSVALTTGSAFFEKLILNMTEAVGAQIGIITRSQTGEPPHSRTVVAVIDGKIVSNFDIPMSGTPCENLSGDVSSWIVHSRVIEQYPRAEGLAAFGAEAYVGRRIEDSMGQSMGQIFVLFRQPLVHTDFVASVLKIFTSRVAAELERQEKQALINEQASWLNEARHVVIVRGLDHRIMFWNQSAEKLYGWSKEEALGRSVADLLYSDPAPYYAATNSTLETGEWRGEISQRHKDGSALRVNAHCSLIFDEQGQPKSIFAINQDMTNY